MPSPSRTFPFGSTVNPEASEKARALVEAVRAHQAIHGPGTLPGEGSILGLCRQFGISAPTVRNNLAKNGILTPTVAKVARESGDSEGEERGDSGEVDANENGSQVLDVELVQGEIESQEHGAGGKRFQNASEYNLSPIAADKGGLVPDRKNGLLGNLEQDRHDYEVAKLCRDSIAAFKAGKAGKHKGSRVIPITKVGDLVQIDTLYRRATRQGGNSGPGDPVDRRPINVQILNQISQETVRPDKGETRIALPAREAGEGGPSTVDDTDK